MLTSKIIESNKISYEVPTDPGSWSWAKESLQELELFECQH